MRYLFFILTLFLIISCSEEISSKDVAAGEILRYYHVYCNDRKTVYVTAEFYAQAGLTIPPFREPYGIDVLLEPPSIIRFNGMEMKLNRDIFGDLSYKLTLREWPDQFRWEWIDQNGRTHIDEASMDKIALGEDYLIMSGEDYAVRWQGSPIGTGEEITLTIEGDELEFFETSEQRGARQIMVQGSGYTLDPLGFYTISISRTLRLRRVTEISVENVAGSFIKLVYQYND